MIEIRLIGDPSLVTGDTAAFTETFDTRNVGTGKTLTPAGSVNDGNGGNNYAVTFVATTATGQITPLAITVAAASSTKGYDGTTSSTATPTITPSVVTTGVVATGVVTTPAGSFNAPEGVAVDSGQRLRGRHLQR